jgi:hypothetical protein
MGAIVIGFVYGVIWYSLTFFVNRMAAIKTQNVWILSFLPLIVFVPVFLSVLLLKPFVDDWESFICIWFFSLMLGALIMKFGVINRLYK